MKIEEYNVEIPQDGETWEGMGALGTTPVDNAENYRIYMVMTPEQQIYQQIYKEWLSGLAREGKLSIMQGCDLDYQCLTTNDGKNLIFAFGDGCSACFTPSEWNALLDEVYSLNTVYQAPFEDIIAIPYEDEDGWPCVRFELRKKLQQISREEVEEKYIAQGTSSNGYPFKQKLNKR